ncbi:MAG: hypothetical protein ACM3UR_01925, partial [Bacteroidota bacterium]
QVSGDFTQNLMKKIERVSFHYTPKKSYFFRFVVASFLILTAAIMIAAILAAKAASPAAVSEPAWYKAVLDTISAKFTGVLSVYDSLFTSRSVSILGSGLAFIILVSIYIVYESFKGVKGRLH